MEQLPKLPTPLWLNTHDPNIGIRLQSLFDADAVLRLAVVLSVGGEEWPPFIVQDPEDAHKQVKALFLMMDCYGPVSIGTKPTADEGSHRCSWAWHEDDRDDAPETGE